MSYPKRLSPLREAELSSILQKISALQPSESTSIISSPEGIKRIRESLYIHFRNSGTKFEYKLKQLSMTELHILRRTPISISFTTPETVLEPSLQKIFEDCLLPILNEGEVEATISSLLKEEKISSKEAITLISTWRRVNG